MLFKNIFPKSYPSPLEKFRQCYVRRPYTYYIGWFDLNIWYYGVRFAKECGLVPENDLWINYFTSCKGVQRHREEYGEPDYIAIHKTFNTIFEAQEYETNILKRFKESGYWDYFINKTTNKSIDSLIGDNSPSKRIDVRNKISKNHGSKTDSEFGNKISEALKGKTNSEDHKRRISNSMVGENHYFYNKQRKEHSDFMKNEFWTEERKNERSGENHPFYGKENLKMQGENHPFYGKERPEMQGENNPAKRSEVKEKLKETIICPYCQKEGSKNNMKRYHFNNCKYK